MQRCERTLFVACRGTVDRPHVTAARDRGRPAYRPVGGPTPSVLCPMSTRRASIRNEEPIALAARPLAKKAAIILALMGLSLCVATSAEESADGGCAEAAAKRVRTVPGAVINAVRSKQAAPIIGAPDNERSFRVEVDITSSSINGAVRALT